MRPPPRIGLGRGRGRTIIRDYAPSGFSGSVRGVESGCLLTHRAASGSVRGNWGIMALRRGELEAFLERDEGARPPVFVGREDILKDILSRSRMAWRATDPRDMAKTTRVLQGAPGAGKTSCLAELWARSATRVIMGRNDTDPAPRVLILGSGRIKGPETVLLPLARTLNPDRAPDFLAKGSRVRTVSGGINAPIIGVNVEGSEGTCPATPDPDWDAFRVWVESWAGPQGLPAPVILAIDEAQRLKRTDEDPLAKLLQSVHDGDTGLPVTLVLAGLGGTLDAARAMGLTRVRHHEIGALAPEETRALMIGFHHTFEIDSEGHVAHLEALAEPTEGWPRHLHIALQAIGRAALTAGGDLKRVNWDRVSREAAEGRRRHYEDQRSPEMEDSEDLVAKVMQAIPGANAATPGARLNDILRIIEASLAEDPGHRLPRGQDPQAFLTHLVQQGALQRKARGLYHCPIPSFRRHLVEAGGLDPDVTPSLGSQSAAEPESGTDFSTVERRGRGTGSF